MQNTKDQKLRFEQDGDDLVISMPLTVNNSPHVLWTQVVRQPGVFSLCYEVIQNRDLFVRSRKEIVAAWRIPNHRRESESYRVERGCNPTTKQLIALLPQLQELVDLGGPRAEATD